MRPVPECKLHEMDYLAMAIARKCVHLRHFRTACCINGTVLEVMDVVSDMDREESTQERFVIDSLRYIASSHYAAV